MRLVALSVLVFALLARPLPGISVAHAQEDDEGYSGEYDDEEAAVRPEDQAPVPADYEDALAAYGSWGDDDQYGRVWEPAVSVGWAPYVDGSWAWTPYGWTWVSSEPWAWTFHYGRWAPTPAGWAWVPGFVWGPAWVDWFWGDGFVGWAPLGPFAAQVTVINTFVFVHDRDFCSRDLVHAVVDHHLVPDHVIHRWQQRAPNVERPPSLHHIERVSQHGITRLDHRPPGTVPPRRFEREPRLARPGRSPHRLGNAWQPGGLPPRDTPLARPWAPARPTRAPELVRRASPPPMAERPAPRWASPPPARGFFARGFFARGEGPRVRHPAAPAKETLRPAPPAIARGGHHRVQGAHPSAGPFGNR